MPRHWNEVVNTVMTVTGAVGAGTPETPTAAGSRGLIHSENWIVPYSGSGYYFWLRYGVSFDTQNRVGNGGVTTSVAEFGLDPRVQEAYNQLVTVGAQAHRQAQDAIDGRGDVVNVKSLRDAAANVRAWTAWMSYYQNATTQIRSRDADGWEGGAAGAFDDMLANVAHGFRSLYDQLNPGGRSLSDIIDGTATDLTTFLRAYQAAFDEWRSNDANSPENLLRQQVEKVVRPLASLPWGKNPFYQMNSPAEVLTYLRTQLQDAPVTESVSGLKGVFEREIVEFDTAVDNAFNLLIISYNTAGSSIRQIVRPTMNAVGMPPPGTDDPLADTGTEDGPDQVLDGSGGPDVGPEDLGLGDAVGSGDLGPGGGSGGVDVDTGIGSGGGLGLGDGGLGPGGGFDGDVGLGGGSGGGNAGLGGGLGGDVGLGGGSGGGGLGSGPGGFDPGVGFGDTPPGPGTGTPGGSGGIGGGVAGGFIGSPGLVPGGSFGAGSGAGSAAGASRYNALTSLGGAGSAAGTPRITPAAPAGPAGLRPAAGGSPGGVPIYPPMAGGMGGAGGAGGDRKERERHTWLAEDREVWGLDPDASPAVVGRPNRTGTQGRSEHDEFEVDLGQAGRRTADGRRTRQ